MKAPEILTKISELTRAIPSFTGDTAPFPKSHLELILTQLKEYDESGNLEPLKGTRPERKLSPSEETSKYRARLAIYIKENTGIKIPVNSTVVARFYDSIADYLGL